MITKAEIADAYRQRMAARIRCFGTGTLMSSATRWAVAPRPAALDPDALHASECRAAPDIADGT